jgi:hypothetical protein
MIYDKHHPNCYGLLRRPHRLLISGSRTYQDQVQFETFLNEHIKKLGVSMNDIVFISGGASKGADAFIEAMCKDNEHMHVIVYPADWDKHKKSAGYIRNNEMVAISSQMVVWWDGVSKGTKHVIDAAKDASIRFRVYLVNGRPNL